MAIIGLLFILGAGAVTAGAIYDGGESATIEVFGLSADTTIGGVFIAGLATMLIFFLGVWLLFSSMGRSRRKRMERKQARNRQKESVSQIEEERAQLRAENERLNEQLATGRGTTAAGTTAGAAGGAAAGTATTDRTTSSDRTASTDATTTGGTTTDGTTTGRDHDRWHHDGRPPPARRGRPGRGPHHRPHQPGRDRLLHLRAAPRPLTHPPGRRGATRRPRRSRGYTGPGASPGRSCVPPPQRSTRHRPLDGDDHSRGAVRQLLARLQPATCRRGHLERCRARLGRSELGRPRRRQRREVGEAAGPVPGDDHAAPAHREHGCQHDQRRDPHGQHTGRAAVPEPPGPPRHGDASRPGAEPDPSSSATARAPTATPGPS